MNSTDNSQENRSQVLEQHETTMGFISTEVDMTNLGSAGPAKYPTIDDQSLVSFLSRPLLIHSYDSSTSTTEFTLDQFFGAASVIAKLRNYTGIRYDIHLRLEESSSPFFYGTHHYGVDLIDNPNALHFTVNTSTRGFYTNPGVNNPYEVAIPYCRPEPYQIITNGNLNGLVNVQLVRNKLVDYLSALDGILGSINVRIYMWLTNVSLLSIEPTGNNYNGPPALMGFENETISLAPIDEGSYQSREFRGAISHPASIISSISKLFIPVFGPFATAFQIASHSVAEIASLFGFSKPNNLQPVCDMVSAPHRGMYAATGLDNCDLLAMDPKSSVAISSSIINGDGTDAMAFASIFGRGAVVSIINFQSTSTVGTALMAMPITPGRIPIVGEINHLTPLSMVAFPFKYWRGSLKYKFRCISSAYHRGVVRIAWVPRPIDVTTVLDAFDNTSINCLWDISSSDILELEVGWRVNQPYKRVARIATDLLVTDYHTIEANCNGFLYMIVVQPLTCTDIVNSIKILVEVSGGKDFEVAVPTKSIISLLHSGPYNVAQTIAPSDAYPFMGMGNISAKIVPTDDGNYQAAPFTNNSNKLSPKTTTYCTFHEGSMVEFDKIVIGERFDSVRKLCKPFQYQGSLSTLIGGDMLSYVETPLIPRPTGTIVGTSAFYPNVPSYITYFSSFFKWRRGGIKYKLIPSRNDILLHAVRARYQQNDLTPFLKGQISLNTPANFTQLKSLGMQGIASFNVLQGGGITFEIPAQPGNSLYYENYRPTGSYVFPRNEGALILATTLPANALNSYVRFDSYVCAAEDFSLDGFFRTESMYMYPAIVENGSI